MMEDRRSWIDEVTERQLDLPLPIQKLVPAIHPGIAEGDDGLGTSFSPLKTEN